MSAYYNENDRYAAQWLRNLIAAGHIAPGDVDERSIVDVRPDDLKGYTQCHFFAGIGGWSLALRLSLWPDDRHVWTGSCPCQPFSAAGKGKAADDERHLWPAWFSLIRECRPAAIFGEQVEAAIGWGWLDAVFSDLEAEGYACGAAVLPACGVGAPHIRQRLWFVGNTERERAGRDARASIEAQGGPVVRAIGDDARPSSAIGELADADAARRGTGRSGEAGDNGAPRLEPSGLRADGMGDADRRRSPRRHDFANEQREVRRSSPWDDLVWLPCTDGKARPTQSPVQFMADGLPESLGRVRSGQIAQIEEEIDAEIGERNRGQAVFNLWSALATETVWRPIGGLRSLQEAPLLLAFMCELAEQGWPVPEGVPQSRTQASEAIVRMLRDGKTASGASCGRGLDKQSNSQSANFMRVLSSILAQHAQAAWGEAFDKNADDAFPLATGIPGRVGKLRAAGNAIVPQVAAEFIRACA